MNVVILTNIMAPYRVDLFNYLSKTSRHNITVLYSSENEDNRKWKIDNINHKYKILNSKTIKIKKKLDYKYIHLPTDIIKVLNEINPDIIIGSEYNPVTLLSFIWCKKNKKNFVSWSDGTLNSERDIKKIKKVLRRIICTNADKLLASSTKTKEAQIYYGASEENIYTSFLTVDINKYTVDKSRKNFRNKLIYVGGLSKRKGLDLLFKSLSRVKNEYSLDIVGDGEEIEFLKDLANKLGILKNINFLGHKDRNELIKLYSESDIFVLPTRCDCFGLVITEAMCAGLPLIVSKFADGAFDLLENHKGGYIVDPYDSEVLSEKIDKLLSDKILCTDMGNFNKEKVKCFSIENVGHVFLECIESLS